MKALIFGAYEQVGRALADTAPTGAEVIGLGRSDCDISCRSEVERSIAEYSPDLVFNAAAFTAVDRAETAAVRAAEVNAAAPGHVAEAARTVGARTVHISIDYVFDGTASRPYRPTDRPNPINVYGLTKLAGEEAVRRADPGALIVRTAWVYSASGTNFVTNTLRMLREDGTLQVAADQVGTPTRAESLSAALWALGRAGVPGLLHYCDSGSASRHEFAVAIRDYAYTLGLLDRKIPIEPLGTVARQVVARPAYSVLDATRAWQIIGDYPAHWRDNLRLTLEAIGTTR